jgi:hypothetical protein
MDIGYSILFSLDLTHPYYTDGRCRNAVLIPTAATRDWMRAFDLLLKVKQGSFFLLYNAERKEDLNNFLLASKNIKAEFIIYSPDAYFRNYTSYPAENFIDGVYVFTIKSNGKTLTVLSRASDVINNDDIIANKRIQKFPPIGFISVMTNTTVLQNGATNEFEASFPLRPVTWKYIVTGKSFTGNGFSVINKSGKDDNSFNDPGELILDNGETATVFQSANEIAITERSKTIFQLIKNSNGNAMGETLIDALPVATAKYLKYDNDEKKWYSEIYIHM